MPPRCAQPSLRTATAEASFGKARRYMSIHHGASVKLSDRARLSLNLWRRGRNEMPRSFRTGAPRLLGSKDGRLFGFAFVSPITESTQREWRATIILGCALILAVGFLIRIAVQIIHAADRLLDQPGQRLPRKRRYNCQHPIKRTDRHRAPAIASSQPHSVAARTKPCDTTGATNHMPPPLRWSR